MGTKNKIEDLRNIVFAALERLDDDDTMKNPITLEKEIKRAAAIADLAQVIVNSAKVEVDFIKATEKDGTGFINDEQKKLG
jgi:BioD-like phosphotransacetylase family protein